MVKPSKNEQLKNQDSGQKHRATSAFSANYFKLRSSHEQQPLVYQQYVGSSECPPVQITAKIPAPDYPKLRIE